VGTIGLVSDFKNWVNDAWYEMQLEKKNPPWWFMMSLDQTLAITASTDSYSIPAGLATLDWRTPTIYTTAKADETPLCYIPYDVWRLKYDTKTYQEQRPQYITLCPDNTIKIFPVPDQAYTLRFDGVLLPAELSADTDEPANLQDEYHRVIAWGAIMRYATHHEDGAALMNAQNKFRSIYDKMVQRQVEQVQIEVGRLYGNTPTRVSVY
jgi:hypothetical protein